MQLQRIATDTTSLAWEPDLTVAKLAAIAVSTGQWAVAELLLEVETADIPEVLQWYRNR
jgi:hypothetical protein